ncbi:MAG: ADP-ribosylglycohydrolase family protein [Oscillospiraceae bacterium]|jgi:ADP-ribosylglycohydrolase
MEKAWERARKLTDSARPKKIEKEDRTWSKYNNAGEEADKGLMLHWRSSVPGSSAPESIMLAAIQAKENQGYIVKNGMELYDRGLEAMKSGDMIALNMISSEIWREVERAEKDPSAPSWKFKRYGDWKSFREACRFPAAGTPDEGSLEERIMAGWTAQIIGGAIGTEIEGYTTDAIREVFGNVTDYISEPDTFNDDITYELAFLKAFEEKGSAVGAEDIALNWVGLIPSGWSAEEMALRNIAMGIMPPESASVVNPFGEWIGAQMRGAVCGMLAPCSPEEAARLAWIDGSISHYSNGIIGEVFNAMLVSLAFGGGSMREIVKSCVEALPQDCEYAHFVRSALEWSMEDRGWEDAWRKCEKFSQRYNWIHAYPNAMAEVVALWYGDGSFDRTINIIAMEGQDVDCNAAQILTAVGAASGMQAIPERWSRPIGGMLQTYMRKGYDRIPIDDLSKRTFEAWKNRDRH